MENSLREMFGEEFLAVVRRNVALRRARIAINAIRNVLGDPPAVQEVAGALHHEERANQKITYRIATAVRQVIIDQQS